MQSKFFNSSLPPLTAMVQASTPDEAICIIEEALYDGADAFGIQLCSLEKQYRNEETLKNIFSYCENKPIYITSYRARESADLTDDECGELLLLGLKCGATLCDVMGDMFHPEPHELTFDKTAVQKQKELIDKIHSLGGEVLISSHLHTYFPEEKIVEYAKEQVNRGADVVKIVSFANTEDEEYEAFKIIRTLKNTIDKPFLFLVNGKRSKLIRQVGPAFGVCTYLCVSHYRPVYSDELPFSKEQPLLRACKAIRDNMNF